MSFGVKFNLYKSVTFVFLTLFSLLINLLEPNHIYGIEHIFNFKVLKQSYYGDRDRKHDNDKIVRHTNLLSNNKIVEISLTKAHWCGAL